MSKVILHPEYGINPTIVQKLCTICGKKFDTNELALLGRNKGKKAEMYTLMGCGTCDKCKELLLERNALIVVSNAPTSGCTLTNEEANRTGEIMWIKKTAAKRIFGNDKIHVAFITVEQAEVLKNLPKKPKENINGERNE